MTVQFVDIDGQKVAIMPIADYERLVDEAEDRLDLRAAAEAESRRAAGEEYLPAAMVDRLLAGESPLRVWRKHRGLTQQQLGERAGISYAHVSDIERQAKAGTARVLKKLAAALQVTVDDILPADPA